LGVVAREGEAAAHEATAPTAFQVRVMLSIGVMLRTPSLEPGDGRRGAPSRVSSAVGTLRVPSLSFRRLT
jgi:hypothetical protein